jgi:hypothetical protein
VQNFVRRLLGKRPHKKPTNTGDIIKINVSEILGLYIFRIMLISSDSITRELVNFTYVQM